MEDNKVVKKREEINLEDKWKLEKIYANEDAWEKDFNILKKESPKLREFAGKLNDKEEILKYLELNEKVSRLGETLYVYAHMKSDEDTSNQKYQSYMNKIDAFMAEFASYGAFFVPEILALPDEFIKDLIKNDERFKIYEFMLMDILKEKPHILTKEMEELLALASDCLDAPSSIHNMLTNADMTFGNIKDEDGDEVELTEGNYSSFIKSKDRSVREAAFKRLFGEYKKFDNTLATTLTSSVKSFNFSARVRKYESPIEASLSPNDIPVSVYENAIKTINDNLSSLHRYVKIKKKLLGLEQMHMYDLYVPLTGDFDMKITYEEAKEIILEALKPMGVKLANEGLKPLGEEYLNLFNEGINSGWIDKYENKGKRGGAYSWGGYDTMPYVLLNYHNELNDVSTLVHEMGHSLHSYYSRKTQPYYYAGYTLFCAEVASTTNEALLIHYLIEKEQDKKKKLYLINQELEQIRTTVFRQLMFAEFELYTHNALNAGEALTAADYSAKWHELNANYFGPDMVVDEDIDMEWARIPHFYSDFYVYQYATGYAAASAFANAILEGKENAVEKYKGFLKAGGSKYPIDILKDAGVDMTTSEPLEATIHRFNELLDMLEEF